MQFKREYFSTFDEMKKRHCSKCMNAAGEKPTMNRFRQPFPIQPSVCSYLVFYLPLFGSQHISTPWCSIQNGTPMPSASHTLRSDSIFSPSSAKVILLLLFEYVFTLLLSRNKSNVCGAGLCLWELWAAVLHFFFISYNTFWKTYHAELFFAHNTEHTNKHKCLQRKSKDVECVAIHSLAATPSSVAVTCKHRAQKRRKSEYK